MRSVFDVNHEIKRPKDDGLGEAETRLYDAADALRTHVRQDAGDDPIVGEDVNKDALLLRRQFQISHVKKMLGSSGFFIQTIFTVHNTKLLKHLHDDLIAYLDIDQHEDSLQNQGLLHKPVIDEKHVLLGDFKKREEPPHA